MVGAAYVGFVATKTALLLWTVGRGAPGRAGPPGRLAAAVFLGTFLPWAALDGYVATRISTTGDEPYYLLLADSLVRDGDLDLANQFARRLYLPFYWGTLDDSTHMTRTADGRIYSRAHAGLQPILLAPGYRLAGRVGAMITVSALGSLALALGFRVALALGAGRGSALLAWLTVAYSVPVLSLAGSPFPELPAACLTIAAAALLLAPRATIGHRLAALACGAALLTIKIRFLVSVGALAAGAPRRLSWRGLAGIAALGLGLLGAAFVYDAVLARGLFLGYMRHGSPLAPVYWLARIAVGPVLHLRSLAGLLLDQEHGLFLVAPALALVVPGLAILAATGRWRALLLFAGPSVLTWYLLGGFVVAGVPMWGGGFSPPARYLASTLPGLIAPLALTLDRLRGRLAWTATAGLCTLTLGHAVALTIWPELRFQHHLGRATALAEVAVRTGLDVGRWLPSYVGPAPGWTAAAGGLLAALALAGGRLARRPGRAPRPAAVATGALAAGLLVAVAAVAAWARPDGTWPAAPWQGRGGTGFRGVLTVDGDGRIARADRVVWAAQGPSVVTVAPRLPAGRYRLILRAGAQAGDAVPPRLTIHAGEAPPWRVALDAAEPPVWRERDYPLEVRTAGGRVPVRIELAGIASHPPIRLAYLRSLEIIRLGP